MSGLKLSGINSGYDSEAMIKEMMSAYQTKIDNQNKKLTKLQWKQEAYRDVTTKLTNFQNKYFDILNKGSYLMSPTTFSKFKSNITTKSGADVKGSLSVTTTSASKEGSYSLKVLQTASKAKLTGGKINPAGFSLDLEKAAESNYENGTDADGNAVRNYDFALDVKVGDVTKTVEFKFSVKETDGNVTAEDFSKGLTDALNPELEDLFGTTGRTSGVTGAVNADGKELFLAAEASADGKTLNFKVGGNATVSITEKTGNFGLAKAATKQAISMQSCVTGKNTVSITVGDTTKNVSFEGVAATYFDSRNDKGNEAVLAEYNKLKEAAYRKENNLSSSAAIDSEKLNSFTYTSVQAAKDKNSAAFTAAAEEAFKDEGYDFDVSDGYLTITKDTYINKNFSITSVEGGTLGLTKGNATNKITDNVTLREMGITDKNSDLNINGKTVSVKADMTIKDFLDAVNKSGAGVTMSYSTVENRFIVEANDMGSGGNVELVDNELTQALGITGSEATVVEGKNAIFELDGVEIYHNSNSYEVDGTKFDFTDAVENETYKVGISKDYEDVKTLIKDFVKDYNQLIDDVYGHIGTTPARDSKNNTYEPLTDEEKDEMSEEEVEKWEKTAKKGVIYNDSTISSIMSQIRSTLYNTITTDDGSKFGIFNMGIATIPYDYESHGKLEIDEDAFNKAFDENPDAVAKLFTDADNGIMKKIDTILDNAVSTTTSKTGSIRGSLIRKAGLEKGSTAKNNEIFRQMEQINKRINTLQDRYDAKENYWWDVFTNLEKMMGKFNDQSAYLSNYLGGGTTM
ncbi:MAG: flagellar filament capping protein FliD [Oscillospiraceae bacterium]